MSIDQIAWVGCDHPGCQDGLVIDARHTRNFEGRSWTCTEHQTPTDNKDVNA